MEHQDPPLFQFFNEVGIIEQLSRNWLEKRLPDGLRLSHFTMLNHLVRLGDGKTPVELARSFQVTKAAVTNTVNRLVQREMLIVEDHPTDRRSKLVYLTNEGRNCRENAVKATAESMAIFAGKVNMDEFAAALPFLAKVRAILDEARM